ncbi:MAG TPA: hypothetical protein PKY77_15000 [Phycisphaerae bacterium]|nr:hypothetical protein [Phycisphaerae bacterium]HRY70448.1 hypothetical protein [Phycisphaerae bacterium]HSA27682.1 hypothetical protein [Phycisphaerae bacterium]
MIVDEPGTELSPAGAAAGSPEKNTQEFAVVPQVRFQALSRTDGLGRIEGMKMKKEPDRLCFRCGDKTGKKAVWPKGDMIFCSQECASATGYWYVRTQDSRCPVCGRPLLPTDETEGSTCCDHPLATGLETIDGLTIYSLDALEMDPQYAHRETTMVAGPGGYDPMKLDPGNLPEGFHWVTRRELKAAYKRYSSPFEC